VRPEHLRRRIAASPLAPVAAFPVRLARVARHDGAVIRESVRWLATSREHHNYTYDLTDRNVEHLAWWVRAVSGRDVVDCRRWLGEILGDEALRGHLESALGRSDRRGLADRTVRYGRRIGWYALVRALGPAHVVETGVDKGLGSCVLAAALLRNAEEGRPGRLTACDINPAAGYLVRSSAYETVVDLRLGDSVATLQGLEQPVDLFLHDSDHSVEHEQREVDAVEPRLAGDAVLLTDNATETDVLVRHAVATGRDFLFFREQPARHWFPGEGIGAAWRTRA